MQLLSRGIEHGLTCESDDPGQSAGDRVMSLAVSRPIETAQSDLLAVAEHYAALSDMIVYLLRTGEPWLRPEPVMVGEHLWVPESFIGPSDTLRRVVLVDRWDEARETAESFDWRTLEAAVYGLPMTLVVVVLGASRDGRRHGPLSKGWVHPVSQDLRFKKRDDTNFGPTWNTTFREAYKGEREEWFDAMAEDGVAEEAVILQELDPSPNQDALVALANSKLSRLLDTAELPEPQLAQCFDPIRQCPFRSTCPYFRMPSESNGFIRTAPRTPLSLVHSHRST